MRAKMSDRTSRPSRSEYLPCEPQSAERTAEAEARAILAETEPHWPAACILFVGSQVGRREIVTADWWLDRDWLEVTHAGQSALAESIARFVEQLQ